LTKSSWSEACGPSALCGSMRPIPTMADRPPPSWREPLGLFALVVVALAVLTTAAHLFPTVQPHIALMAAVLFVGVPFLALRRRGEDLTEYGLALDLRPFSQFLWGLGVAAAVFLPFAAGYHLWETRISDREFAPSVDHYLQWPIELEAQPISASPKSSAQVATARGTLQISFAASPEDALFVLVEADRPFRWHPSRTVRTIPAPAEWFDSPSMIDPLALPPGMSTLSDRWLLQLFETSPSGSVSLRGPPSASADEHPTQISFQVFFADASGEVSPAEGRLILGDHREESSTQTARRTLVWILLWSLTHLIVVALPEEYFYRGYLQTRIHRILDPGEGAPRQWAGFTAANWITSALFALGHVLVPIAGTLDPARAAVFFPSLLFGWLRERTGTIIAPTVLHACSNMMILVLQVHYF
jgi:membrane protease YdiL (CAAX protease family)